MNCIATDLELKQYAVQTDMPVMGDSYMTQPMPVMTLPCGPVDEEEVYSSFEEALSERQRAIQWKLRLLSNAALHTVRDTDPLAQQSVTSARTNVKRIGVAHCMQRCIAQEAQFPLYRPLALAESLFKGAIHFFFVYRPTWQRHDRHGLSHVAISHDRHIRLDRVLLEF